MSNFQHNLRFGICTLILITDHCGIIYSLQTVVPSIIKNIVFWVILKKL
jgi:hypothetical protein